MESNEIREDLGYRENTTANPIRYPINRDKRMPREQGRLPQDVCRVRFKHGQYAGEIKRAAWEYAGPWIEQGKCEFVEWVK